MFRIISKGVNLRWIEPHLFSVFSDVEVTSTYDTSFGNIYDWVACNPVYNRLIWGYSVSIFASIAYEALRSSKKGNVLDLGCGSLAFTAKTYIQYSERPVVLVDQSLKMLRIARSRLIKHNGAIPDNMIFLQADALRLPFQEKSFNTIISENLLHCIHDTKIVLTGLKNVLTEDGRMYFTTLVKGDRLADRYLEALAAKEKLVPRSIGDHQAAFNQIGMFMKYEINGNMASICYDQKMKADNHTELI